MKNLFNVVVPALALCSLNGVVGCIKKQNTASKAADYQVEDPKNRTNTVVYLDNGTMYRVTCGKVDLNKVLTRADCPHQSNEHAALSESEYRSRLAASFGSSADDDIKKELAYKEAQLNRVSERQESETKQLEQNPNHPREDFLPTIRALEEQIHGLQQLVEKEKAVDAIMAFFKLGEKHQGFSVESESKLILKPFER